MAYVLTITVKGSGKAILTASGGEVLSVFSGESKTISLSVGEIVNMLFQADSGGTFIKACDSTGDCQYVPQMQYTILQDMTNTITAEFTVADVIINIINSTGNGVIKSSSGITPLGEWASITVKYGDSLYLQAIPNSGYVFDKWMSADGTIATQNPITIPNITQPGSVTGYFKSATSSGFSLTANGQSSSVKVANSASVTLAVSGADPNTLLFSPIEIRIKNVWPLPDTTIASGNPDSSGVFTANWVAGNDETIILTAFQPTTIGGVIGQKISNPVTVTVGSGANNTLTIEIIIIVIILGLAWIYFNKRS